MIMRVLFSIALCFAINVVATNEPFSAYVDKTTISDTDSVTLTLEYEGKWSEQPDVSSLTKDFQIISQSRGSESSYINGAQSQKTKWIYELEPRHTASSLTIPSFKLGAYTTKPIVITVSALKQPLKERGISLVASCNNASVYVHGELLVTLELKTTLALQNGTLGKPEIKDAIVEPLIENDDKEMTENGIRTFVFRRVYAVYPNKPGELVIPSVNFEGVVNTQRGWFSQGRRMAARSQPIPIKVLPIPESYPKDQPFLPVKNLVVIESFDSENPQFALNQATTRRFEIKALGTLASFLPMVQAPVHDGLKVYTESGTKENKKTEEGSEASLKFSHVYMPTSGGAFSIPEQKIYWWDTEKNELRTKTIRAFEFSVAGAVAPHAVSGTQKIASLPERPEESHINTSPKTINYWMLLTLLFAALWVFTLIVWLLQRKKKTINKNAVLDQSHLVSLKSLEHALDSGNVREAISHLRVLLNDKNIATEQAYLWIMQLEKSLYGQANQEETSLLIKSIRQQLPKIIHVSQEASLPELYPS